MKFGLPLALVFLLLTAIAYGDELVLKSGQKLEGKIVEQTEKYIKFDSGVDVVTTYYDDEIATLNGQAFQIKPPAKPEATPARTSPEVAANTKDNLNKPSNQYVITEDEKKDYTDILSSIFLDSKNKSTALSDDFISLNNFISKHPGSPLADDAYYVLSLTEFEGAVTANNRDKNAADKIIDNMQQFVQQHPQGSTTELTWKIWRECGGEKSTYVLNIPYNLIVDYMMGHMAYFFRDDINSIKYHTILTDQLNFDGISSEESKEALLGAIYFALAVSYLRLHQQDGLKEVIRKVGVKFPDQPGLKHMLESLLENGLPTSGKN